MPLIKALFILLLLGIGQLTFAKAPVFVSADWVKANQDKIKLIDMSEQMDYRKFHLENATWVNYAWLIRPQDGLQLSGGEGYMTQVLSKLGISNTDYVVIYDSMGGLEASRLYWELAKLNHSKVSILNGGLVSWVLKGYPVTQTIVQPKPTGYLPPKTTLTDAFTADKNEVLAAIQSNKVHLLDARSKEEYLGSPKQKRSGHIPTAQLFPWDATVMPDEGFRQRSDEGLQALLKQVGITSPQDQIIIYCHTGHRAARLWTALQSLGYRHVKLYDGSTQEWSLDPRLPLIVGSQAGDITE